MNQEIWDKLKQSSDRELIIQAIEGFLDEYCDVRTDSATAEEKRYLHNSVLNGIINKIEKRTEPIAKNPVTYE